MARGSKRLPASPPVDETEIAGSLRLDVAREGLGVGWNAL